MSEIVEQFAAIARNEPGRPLIHVPAAERTLTAADIWHGHHDLARALTSLGIGRGDLVVCAIGNRPDLLPLLLACRGLDVALMAVDTSATHAEVASLCGRFGAAAALELTALDLAGPDDVAIGPGLVLRRWAGETTPYPGVAMLKMTSGSSGLPRAARTTESQLVADARQITAAMGIGPADTQLAVIPLAHSYGLGVMVLPLLLHGTGLVLRESFIPQQIAGDTSRYGARCLPGVPFMFEHFLTHGETDQWPSGLRLLISAGARLSPATQRAFHDRFGVKIHTFYGTTETGGITYDDRDGDRRRGDRRSSARWRDAVAAGGRGPAGRQRPGARAQSGGRRRLCRRRLGRLRRSWIPDRRLRHALAPMGG